MSIINDKPSNLKRGYAKKRIKPNNDQYISIDEHYDYVNESYIKVAAKRKIDNSVRDSAKYSQNFYEEPILSPYATSESKETFANNIKSKENIYETIEDAIKEDNVVKQSPPPVPSGRRPSYEGNNSNSKVPPVPSKPRPSYENIYEEPAVDIKREMVRPSVSPHKPEGRSILNILNQIKAYR